VKIEEMIEVVEMIMQFDNFVGMHETRRVLDDLNRYGERRLFNAYAYYRSDVRR